MEGSDLIVDFKRIFYCLECRNIGLKGYDSIFRLNDLRKFNIEHLDWAISLGGFFTETYQ